MRTPANLTATVCVVHVCQEFKNLQEGEAQTVTVNQLIFRNYFRLDDDVAITEIGHDGHIYKTKFSDFLLTQIYCSTLLGQIVQV